MKALDVMVRNVVTVKPDDAVADAVKLLAEHDVSALPVVDDGNNVVGIISEADLCTAGRSARKDSGRGGLKR
jgi:CBS domain-containing protein